MMNKFILSTIILCTVPFTASAEADVITLSHCNGEIASSGSVGTSGEQVNSAATLFSADDLMGFEGNQICKIRAGIASKLNIDELTVWVRTSLDGENLAQGTVSTLSKGWLDVDLESAYTIPEDTPLYVGYSYHQKKAAKCISIVDGQLAGGFYMQAADGEWEDRSDLGLLSVEALVMGDNLPQYDINLLSVSTPLNYVVGNDMNVTLEVKNQAVQTITGFTAEVSIDGQSARTVHADCQIAYGEIQTVTFAFNPELTEKTINTQMQVSVTGLDDGEDFRMDNNTKRTSFNVVLHEYKRHMLIEEFTSEACVNCPPAAAMVHEMLETPGYAENVSVVCHHAGYYTDWLSTPNAEEYCWFYNSGGSTYAPAFMWDRLRIEGNTPVTNRPEDLYSMLSLIDQRLAMPSCCYVSATASYDEENMKLKVRVEGDRSMSFCNTPARVTVFVTEDNIKARAQSGSDGNFYHQHALRAYNATFGTIIDWKDNDTFDYECELTVKSSWKLEDCHIVAFVASYDNNNPNNCEIENSCEIAFPVDGGEGILQVGSDVVADEVTLPAHLIGLPAGNYLIGGRRLVVE